MNYKKHIILITGFLLTLSVSSQTYNLSLPTTSNYIRTTSPETAVTTLPAATATRDAKLVDEQIQYFDGLGRPLQTVMVANTPNGKDLIQPIAYDEVGREAIKYLPYADASTNGSYRGNALLLNNTADSYASSDQYKFYQSTTSVVADKYPYSKTVFEPSPLNRVLEQGAPGADWQPLDAKDVNKTGHTQKIVNATNVANEVMLFKVSNNSLLYNNYYAASTLYVTIVTDENNLTITKEYKDKENQVVLKSVLQNGGALQTNTYYVYDDFGLLRYVLSPEFVNQYTNKLTQTSSSDLIKKYGYYYQYDGKKRMTIKQIPGADAVYMVYDKRDRLVLTQDGNMRLANSKQWNFIKYDALNRPVITGIYTHSAIADQTAMQTYLDNTIYPTTGARAYFVTRNNTGTTGYTDVSFPISTDGALDYLTVIFYDSYGFPGVRGFNTTANNISGVTTNSTRVIGQVTGSKERVLGTSLLLTTTNYYDTKYRPIQVLRDLYDGGTTVTSSELVCNKYDFVGRVLQTRQVQTFNAVATTVDKYLTYDHAGRMTKTEMQVVGDATGKVAIAEQTYNEIGQLIDKKLHKTATGTYNQSVDYKYNIRGWLTQINDPGTLAIAGDATDLFAERLHYNTQEGGLTGGLKMYNGNISSQVWNTNGIIQAYNYQYDGLNRLTKGDYKLLNTTWTDPTKYEEDSIRYDFNGNIIRLKRSGSSGAYNGTNGANFRYTYNGNQLNNLNVGTVYSYDKNGNMTLDGRTGNAFVYNLLNLPQIVSKGTDKLNYTYSATGQKLVKKYETGTTTVTTTNQYYVGNMVYNNSKALDYIIFEEGIIRKVSTGYSWEYNLKDHLGNTRAVFVGGATAPALAQTSDYYPFGQTFAPMTTPNNNNKYLYNGKELQTETLGGSSLNMLDYGARLFDPALGRWVSLDPLADRYYKSSPYVYVENSPIVAMDPDGKRILFVNGYWMDNWIGKNIIGSYSSGREYWSGGFTGAAQRFFNDYSSVLDANYIDGSSKWGGDMSGSDRELAGYEYAKANYSSLVDGLGEDETFKLVTHSEGGAYGAGVARYLIEQGRSVETILHLSTDEADEFKNPEHTTTYQLGYGGDWVTDNKAVSGADVFGVVDKFSSMSDKAKYAHGSTKGVGVFKDVKAMLNAAAAGATGVNVTETRSGIKFEFIRTKDDEEKK